MHVSLLYVFPFVVGLLLPISYSNRKKMTLAGRPAFGQESEENRRKNRWIETFFLFLCHSLVRRSLVSDVSGKCHWLTLLGCLSLLFLADAFRVAKWRIENESAILSSKCPQPSSLNSLLIDSYLNSLRSILYRRRKDSSQWKRNEKQSKLSWSHFDPAKLILIQRPPVTWVVCMRVTLRVTFCCHDGMSQEEDGYCFEGCNSCFISFFYQGRSSKML